MKKTLLITGALLALTVGMASAAGVNLGWSDCEGLPASQSRVFACTSNSGTNTLVGSYVTPAGVDSANGNEIVIDIQTSGATLPQWWMMKNAGTCRATALSMSFDFSTGPFTCFDYWAGQALGSFGYTAPYAVYGPNRARIVGVCAIGGLSASGIAPDTEVYSHKVSISNVKSTGLGACAGCSDGACIVLNSIKLTQNQRSAGGPKFMGNPAVRNFATWQAGIPGCGTPATPARNATWGKVKSLYR
jgi:hypothetical protein